MNNSPAYTLATAELVRSVPRDVSLPVVVKPLNIPLVDLDAFEAWEEFGEFQY